MVTHIEHAGCGHGEPTLSMHAGCDNRDPTFITLGVVMVIPI